MRLKAPNNKGYTLIEIVMVIVILGVIGAFTFSFVADGVRAFQKSRDRKDLYDQGRLALERMVRELRDTKEVTDCSSNSITFKVAHPAAFGVVDEIKYQLNGTDLERVGDPSGTPLAAVLASDVTSFSLGGEGGAGLGVDAVSSGTTDGGSSITISHTTSGSDRLMLVGVSMNNDGNETVTGITYNGTSLTLVGTENNTRSGGDDARVEIWSLVAPSTGTHNVVITFSASLQRQAIGGVMTFTGVDQTTPLGTFASAEQDGTSASVDVSSGTDELVFGVVAAETPSGLTAGPGQTERWNRSVASGNTEGAGSTESGSATVTISWTLGSSDHWAIGGVSIKPAAPTVDSCSTGVISFDAASSGTVGASNSLTFSHAIGSGANRILVVGVAIENCGSTPTVTGITYNGQALAPIDSAAVTSSNDCRGRAELWYLLEANLPAAGAYNVVVTTSATSEYISAGAISLIGVNQGAAEATATNFNDGPDTITTNITTLTDGAWIVDVVHNGEPNAFAPDPGQTERYDQASGSSAGAGSTKEVLTAGATSMGWSATANRMAHVVAAFAPAPTIFPLVSLQLTLSSTEGGTVSLRTKVFMRNVP